MAVRDVERLRQQRRQLAHLVRARFDRPEAVVVAFETRGGRRRRRCRGRPFDEIAQLAGPVPRNAEDRAELHARGLQQPQPVLLRARHGVLVRLHRPGFPRLRLDRRHHPAPPVDVAAFDELLLVDVQHGPLIARQEAAGLPLLHEPGHPAVPLVAAFRQLEVDGVARVLCRQRPLHGGRDDVVGRREQVIERARSRRIAQAAERHELGHRVSRRGSRGLFGGAPDR
ncbi:hypothetical protein O0235_14410 [Tepidiforma flava]|uniref:Uncharacterized protein n=1 Tax=Tepidiforma flava TaxID=3004094 RepID=A0ABY7M7F0_9CHLR|nr:hypothetical protein [Tepidiforma flava]WBL35944.1 hypothetical protein O0235_14410 [Tepidiforma flava]